jgi:16S rRNA (cytidine1402-2'-O)-methyltransferase
MFEEIKRGALPELRDYYSEHPPKGEIVIVLEGIPKNKSEEK